MCWDWSIDKAHISFPVVVRGMTHGNDTFDWQQCINIESSSLLVREIDLQTGINSFCPSEKRKGLVKIWLKVVREKREGKLIYHADSDLIFEPFS